MTTMHNISLTIGYQPNNAKWWVIRHDTAYLLMPGESLQEFIVRQAEDYHWEACRELPGIPASMVFYQQILHLEIEYTGTIENHEFITRWWKAYGRGMVEFKNQMQWSDVIFIADWLRERVSEVEMECMMRILTKDAA